MSENYIVHPSENITGEITVPGDKSISHRALILLSISEGTASISNFLESDDCIATANILKKLGVKIYKSEKNNYLIEGVGKLGLKGCDENLDCGNSGTSMRLLSGLLSAQQFESCLVGDSSLNKRPMDRVSKPLSIMGANIALHDEKTAPINIYPAQNILPIEYNMPIDSAQIKSAIMLAALYAKGKSKILEKVKSRDHTENILNYLGTDIVVDNNEITLNPPKKIDAKDIFIPGDISSAMFFIVGCLISKSSKITIKNVGLNPSRIGGIEILKMMGADIQVSYTNTTGPEIYGDIFVTSSSLRGIEIPKEYIPSAIDEFPVLFIAAAAAAGKTILKNAEELKFKESDRLEAMSVGLKKCKIDNSVTSNGIEIFGGELFGANVDSYDDHRIAMAFSIAGIISKGNMKILNTKNVSTSFPDFYKIMKSLGIKNEREIDT